MIALQPAPLTTRPVRAHSASPSVTPSEVEGQPRSSTLEEALAKVKTPADDELAKQQQAFDRMMQLRSEQEREANAIREFGIAQQKKENDFLAEFIRMI
jgi:hypothetical protein